MPRSNARNRTNLPDVLRRDRLRQGRLAAIRRRLAEGTQPPRPAGRAVTAPLDDRVEARVTGAEGPRETRDREAVREERLPVVADLTLSFGCGDARHIDVVERVAADLVAVGGQIRELAPREVRRAALDSVAVDEEGCVQRVLAE